MNKCRYLTFYKISFILFIFALCSVLISESKPTPVSANRSNKAKPALALETKFTWYQKDSLTYGRHEHTATLLLNGRVLIVGGIQGTEQDRPGLVIVEEYDPVSETWHSTGSLNIGRTGHRATLLPDGSVLVTGGKASPSGPALTSVEIYDPIAKTWRIGPPLSEPRSNHTATLLGDGRVLVAGGRFSTNSDDVHASVEIYDPVSQSWTSIGDLQIPRESHSATLLPDGGVLVVNGYNQTWLATNEIYDPANGSWNYIVNPFACHGVAHTATRLLDGKVLVVGGACGSGVAGIRSEVDVYNPADTTWVATTTLPQTREAHTATRLPDGRILVVGGDNGEVPRYTSALIFNPENGIWDPAPSLAAGRRGHTATLLKDNAVLVVGGWGNDASALASVELYQEVIPDSPTVTLTPTDNPLAPTSTITNTPLPPTPAPDTPTPSTTDSQFSPTQTGLPATLTGTPASIDDVDPYPEPITNTPEIPTNELSATPDVPADTPTPTVVEGSSNRVTYLVIMLIFAVISIILMVSIVLYLRKDF